MSAMKKTNSSGTLCTSKLESIRKHGATAQGRKEMIGYLKGKVLTLSQAALARCYDCMSYYSDGTVDCESTECPLYLFMPYRKKRRKPAARKKRTTKTSVAKGKAVASKKKGEYN